MKKRVWLFLASLMFQTAYADFKPQTGFYWNPSEPGYALFYEEQTQSTKALIAVMYYLPEGCPVWTIFSGERQGSQLSANSIQGPVVGQKRLWEVGTIQLNFANNNQTTLTWPTGVVKQLQRYELVPGSLLEPKDETTLDSGWWIAEAAERDNTYMNTIEAGKWLLVDSQGGHSMTVHLLKNDNVSEGCTMLLPSDPKHPRPSMHTWTVGDFSATPIKNQSYPNIRSLDDKGLYYSRGEAFDGKSRIFPSENGGQTFIGRSLEWSVLNTKTANFLPLSRGLYMGPFAQRTIPYQRVSAF